MDLDRFGDLRYIHLMAYKFRFRKSIRIAGVRFNFGKNGYTSTSIGGRGISFNFSKKGTKTTFGLPGTGCSWSKFTPKPKAPGPAGSSGGDGIWIGLVMFLGVGATIFRFCVL
jgi:hypothetical protein